jgi:hypothetical protein
MLMTSNVADERLTTTHRAKLAYIYVRQSSVNQVRQHQESTELQYRLVDGRMNVFRSSTKISENQARAASNDMASKS